MRIKRKWINKRYLPFWVGILLLAGIGFYFCVPRPLFNVYYSTVVESSSGKLLGARIADDEQWRFPGVKTIPPKYQKCLLTFEDHYFYYHPGINVFSLFRALVQNIKEQKIISGGSTITMQVCRLARGKAKRSVRNKLIEMIWALNIELRYSKDEILKMYASHAPFGGNIVGLDAAAWRYFERPPEDLSWAESATLAVLPNAPALVYPGRMDEKLKQKRDRLLHKLLSNGELDSITYQLSIAEPTPEKVNPLPADSYHLVERISNKRKGQIIQTSIDHSLQKKISRKVHDHIKKQQANHIYNAAVLVTEIRSKDVKAYIGNVFGNTAQDHHNHVDIIRSKRSTGSILKPFLYCKMLDEGWITPPMLLPDIPTRFGGFTPMNFDQDYNGAVPASEALARSLNIPAVHMLQKYGVPPFYNFLKTTGMSSLTRNSDHYGLSLILGGAEVSLWDLTGMYTSWVKILADYNEKDGYYAVTPFSELNWYKSGVSNADQQMSAQPIVRASAVYSTLDALLKVNRPESEEGWQRFSSARNIAWKTGTSFGFRDAWALGISGDFVVGVWVGNADGEGRPGLTGVTAAAPLLFDVFELLPNSAWFEIPGDEMEEILVCTKSGYRPGINCESSHLIQIPEGSKVELCKWHKKIHLNENNTFRVNAGCYSVSKMKHKAWFVLPPAMEYYYKKNNPAYSFLPPLLPGCSNTIEEMEFIYPRQWNHIFIPTYLDGTPGQTIFELAHRNSRSTVFWHLDEAYLGKTKGIHQLALKPTKGWHTLVVNDEKGNTITKAFQVVNESQ